MGGLRPAHLRFFRCRSRSVNGSELGLMPAFIQEKEFTDGIDKPLTVRQGKTVQKQKQTMEKSSPPSIESKSETENQSKSQSPNQSKSQSLSQSKSSNQNPSQNQSSQRSVSVTRKAGLMFLGTFASRILGFVRDMVLAALFPRVVTDAWLAAFRIPNFFRRLLGENTLAASFTPLFLETKTKQGAEAAKALHHSIFTLLFYFLLVLSLVGFLQSEKILTLFLSDTGFVEIPEKLNMAQSMLKIMFGFVFFITLFAYFMLCSMP